jgi:hypothetical protein
LIIKRAVSIVVHLADDVAGMLNMCVIAVSVGS